SGYRRILQLPCTYALPLRAANQDVAPALGQSPCGGPNLNVRWVLLLAASHPGDESESPGSEEEKRRGFGDDRRRRRRLAVDEIVHDRDVEGAAIVGSAEDGVSARDPDAVDHRRVEQDAQELERLIPEQGGR